MKHSSTAILSLLLATVLSGCGGSTDSTPGPSNTDTSAAGAPANENTPSTPDAQVQSGGQTEPGNPSGNDLSQNGTSDPTTPTETGTAPLTHCIRPSATSVSFEPFARTRDGGHPLGVYVPYPASGFGWDGSNLCDLEGSREVDVIEVLVPFVRQRPDTDGNVTIQEWINATNAGQYHYETRGNDIDNLLLSPVPRYQDGAGYSEWWAMHDGENLYLRIKISNDNFSPIILDSDQPWHDDSIELFIDGDNSKGDSYDGINDFQVLLSSDNDALPYIAQSSAPGLRIFHRSSGTQTYNIEVTINLESAGIKIGRPFGFDVHINEDDNGGQRDAKWGWFEKTGFDRSWLHPSAFATLLLADCEDRNSCGSYQTLLPK